MSTFHSVILTAILTPLVLLVLVFGWKGLLFPWALVLYTLSKIFRL